MPSNLPRFIPTLTEVVEPGQPLSDMAASQPPAASAPLPAPSPAPQPRDEALLQDDLAEQIAHRVLQRVDAALEERLTTSIRAIVERHTEALMPILREEIVATVQGAVAQALADEFAGPDSSPRA